MKSAEFPMMKELQSATREQMSFYNKMMKEKEMNERIKQLWEDNDTIEVCYPEQGSPVSVSATTLEKFAELIVRECALTLYKSAVNDKQAGFAHEAKIMELAGDMIKQHFGVEE